MRVSSKTNCGLCKGKHYVFGSQGSLAVARACDCVSACDQCGGSGRVVLESEEGTRLCRCKCQKLPDRIERFNRSGIPSRHFEASFGNFDIGGGCASGWDKTKKWAESYVPGTTNQGLVLHGKVGRGKTHLLVAAIRALTLDHGVHVRFVEFTHLLGELKKGFDEGRGQSGTLQSLSEIEVLAIDELGKGKNSDWERTIIDELISRRYNSLKPTLATTNFPPGPARGLREGNTSDPEAVPALIDRIGDRVYSRLTQMCEFQEIQGMDYRTRLR